MTTQPQNCNTCIDLLKELKLTCFNGKKMCTQDELRANLKKSLLELHPDKGGNKEEFQRYHPCIKFLLDNYNCYNGIHNINDYGCDKFLNKYNI